MQKHWNWKDYLVVLSFAMAITKDYGKLQKISKESTEERLWPVTKLCVFDK